MQVHCLCKNGVIVFVGRKKRHCSIKCKDGWERRGEVYRGSQNGTEGEVVWPRGPKVSFGSLSEHHNV